MGDPRGFLKLKRKFGQYRPVCERVADFREVSIVRPEELAKEQSSRCMDCGTPFCHWSCPVGNYIPEWNDLMFLGQWEKAFSLLDAANNLPEITGRICPALCEYSCVLGINDDPVTIRENEFSIIEHAFKKNYIRPKPPHRRTGKKIAVIGSGPAGLSCAAQLNKAGHRVTVFEKDDMPGGILRYGIPDFKLEKKILDRRLTIWKKEGIVFKTSVNAGIDIPAQKLINDFDAIVLSGGSRMPRDLKIEGRDLSGIYFAMDYLIQSNKLNAGIKIPPNQRISAKDKHVVIIGGGDTGADCVGTCNRQGAACVVQVELLPQPPKCRTSEHPWPKYPVILKTSTSHEEGGERRWAVLTKKFIGENGVVKKILCVNVVFEKDAAGCPVMREVPCSEFEIAADMVILAMGFVGPEKQGLLESLGVELDNRGNVKTNATYMTSIPKVFSAGDMRRGQSLIVWAISEGRRAAYSVDEYLMGSSVLPKM